MYNISDLLIYLFFFYNYFFISTGLNGLYFRNKTIINFLAILNKALFIVLYSIQSRF